MVQVLGVAAFMVYSYLFPPNEFGLVSLFYSFSSILLSLISFHIHDTVYRYYYEDKPDFARYITSSLLMVAGLFAVVGLLSFLSRDWIFGKLIKNFPGQLLPAMLVYALSAFFYVFLVNIWTAKRKTKLAAAANIIYNYGKFSAGVAFVLLAVHQVPSTSRIMGETIAVAVLGLVFLALILRSSDKGFSKGVSKDHYQYAKTLAIPFLFLNFSEMILGAFDQWFINNYFGNYDTGIYSFGYKIGALLIGLSQALMLANNNDYYENMNAARYERVAIQTRTLLKLIAMASIGLMFFSNDAVGVLARREAYYAAIPVVKVVALGCFFQAMYSLYARNFVYAKKAAFLTYILLFTGGVNIILNFIFIPQYGYMAAAYTTLVSYIAGFLAIFLAERRLFNYNSVRLEYNFLVIVITVACFAASFPLSTWWGWTPFFLKLLIYGGVFIVLFADRLKEFVRPESSGKS
jgi:O-antigen/teichoic acid export membrane protein